MFPWLPITSNQTIFNFTTHFELLAPMGIRLLAGSCFTDWAKIKVFRFAKVQPLISSGAINCRMACNKLAGFVGACFCGDNDHNEAPDFALGRALRYYCYTVGLAHAAARRLWRSEN